MTHTQAVILGHAIPMCVALQISMEIYVWKKKKARKLGKANGSKENQSSLVYHKTQGR